MIRMENARGELHLGEVIPENVVKLAASEASKSSHQFRLGAVIFHGRLVISKGRNREKTHPKANTPQSFIHAEFDAIRKAPELKGASIYVHRLLRNGEIGLSRPCKYCWEKLDEAGIKNVYYSAPTLFPR